MRPFDLGQVYSTGEAIKAQRIQNQQAPMRNAMLQQQLDNARQSNQFAQNQEQRAQTEFDWKKPQQAQEQSLATLKDLYTGTTEIMNNFTAANRYIPRWKEMGLMPEGVEWDQMNPGEQMNLITATNRASGEALKAAQLQSAKNQSQTFAPVQIVQPDGTTSYVSPSISATGEPQMRPYSMPEGATPVNETPQQETERKIREAREKKRAELEERLNMEGKIELDKRQKVAQAERMEGIRKQMTQLKVQNRKFEKAAELSKSGANTGPIERLLPTFKAQTVALEQLQSELGLDIVGATTFGALSKGELDLSLQTALPTGLDGPELVKWLREKTIANNKLFDYLDMQIDYLKAGGTVEGFLRDTKPNNQQPAQPESQPLMTDEEYAERKRRLLGQ